MQKLMLLRIQLIELALERGGLVDLFGALLKRFCHTVIFSWVSACCALA